MFCFVSLHETPCPYGILAVLIFVNSSSISTRLDLTFVLMHFRLYPGGVDVVLDCLCGEDANKGYGLLKPMGRYILYGMFKNCSFSLLDSSSYE